LILDFQMESETIPSDEKGERIDRIERIERIASCANPFYFRTSQDGLLLIQSGTGVWTLTNVGNQSVQSEASVRPISSE
jgi:hypothetical protein